jgi:hypothetical protein
MRDGAAVDGLSGGDPAVHAAVEHVEVDHAARLERLLGAARAGAGLADEHHRLVDGGADLLGVLAQGVERHVVGARDVRGLVLARRADVQQAHVGAAPEQLRKVLRRHHRGNDLRNSHPIPPVGKSRAGRRTGRLYITV